MSKTHKMVRLLPKQIEAKLEFINNYMFAPNAADGSTFDPNSNVITKNVATLNAELNKDINIQIKRALVYKEIKELFGEELANQYIEQLEKHEIYCHDESYIAPYCVAVSMYPFFTEGLKSFGGDSVAPKHLSSYNGGFINLVFALSSQFVGAVATVEYLLGFDHYARLDYGCDYLVTHKDVIKQELQSVIYAINQPAAARSFQSCFWNISIFDSYYFNSLFKNFSFPDGDRPADHWDSFNKLQKFFLQWFNEERTKALLTFPVITVALLNDKQRILDKKYEYLTANELSKGNSFFIYTSDTVDSLSSCCRLRNDISDQINDFSYSLGAGGVMTGSINVITLNMNRFIQDNCKRLGITAGNKLTEEEIASISYELFKQIEKIHKYQLGFKSLFQRFERKGLLPAYTAGYINLDKQYVTVGINGLMEGLEYLGYIPGNNLNYLKIVKTFFQVISNANKNTCGKYPKLKINTELVPAEGLGVKFAKWDKADNYVVPRDCYNSYLYPVENNNITVIDKFSIHGDTTVKYLDGGSALHINLEDYPTKETFSKLLLVAVQSGCPYFCFNVKVTICNKCGYIDKRTIKACPKCYSTDVDYATRVIGYLRRVTNFSHERQEEEARRHYHVLTA